MSAQEPKILERVFSNRDLFSGRSRRAAILSALSAIVFALLLLVICWTLELCLVTEQDRELVISRAEYESLFGTTERGTDLPSESPPTEVPAPPVASAPAGEVPVDKALPVEPSPISTEPPQNSLVRLSSGFEQVVWRNRDTVWAWPLAGLYKYVLSPLSLSPQLTFLFLLVIGFLTWLIWKILFWWAMHTRMQVSLEAIGQLRSHLHRQCLRLGPADLQGTEVRHVLDLFKKDIEQLRAMLDLWLFVRHSVLFYTAIFLILGILIHPKVFFYCGVPLLIGWLVHQHRLRTWREAKRLAAAHSEDELRLLSESLTRSRLVRGYGMEQMAHQHFKKYIDRYQAEASNIDRRRGPYRRVAWAIALLSMVVAIGLLGLHIMSPSENLSLAGATTLCGCFIGIGWAWTEWQNAVDIRESVVPAAMQLFRYLDRIPQVGQAVGAKFLQPLSRAIEFTDVTYATSDKVLLLDRLSLSISAKKQVAVISTDPRAALALASMLPRYIDPQSGQVMMDGEDIAWVTLESLRAETLLAGGDDIVFTGTVMENIAAGAQHGMTEIMEAAKITHAQHFIQRLPQGYETVIGEHGETLTSGQSFRLALARALVRNPALLIIQEPVTPLDDDTKVMLDDTYQRIAQDRTIIYLPSRLATLRRCDDIILLHQGQVVARGNHAHLVRSSPIYLHWEYVRFNEFRHVVENIEPLS